jgi:hypothetical protein
MRLPAEKEHLLAQKVPAFANAEEQLRFCLNLLSEYGLETVPNETFADRLLKLLRTVSFVAPPTHPRDVRQLSKEDFLARCGNAYDAGLITPYRMNLMARWLDVIMREGHSRLCDMSVVLDIPFYHRNDQWDMVRSFWCGWGGELERLKQNSTINKGRESHFATLAGDKDGYKLQEFAAILSLHCQICATDPHFWWTRAGFCPHK